MNADITAKVEDHGQRLTVMETNMSSLIPVLEENTRSNNELAKQFAVYASKHDTIEQDVKDVKEQLKDHGEQIAAMRPTVESVRGLVWKVVSASLVGGGGVAAILAAVIAK